MATRTKELFKIASKFVGFAILTAIFQEALGTRKPKEGKK